MQPGSPSRGPGWRAAIAATILALSGCVPGAGPTRASHSEEPLARADAEASATDAWPERRQAIEALLQRRSAALAGRDRAAWMAFVADPRSDFGQRQALVFDHLVQLGVTRLDATVLGPAARVAAGPAAGETSAAQDQTSAAGEDEWAADVEQAFQIPGFDRSPRRFAATFTLAAGPWGPRLAADGSGSRQEQVFDLPSMAVARGPDVLVVGNVSAATLADYRDLVTAARVDVSRWWGSCPPVVFVAPATAGEAARQLGRIPGADRALVAATTDGRFAADGTAGADRIVADPVGIARLTVAGRQAVVTHEVMHVAMRASTAGAMPTWLSEGLAQYVGFAAAGVPLAEGTAELLVLVRAGHLPQGVPSDAEFDPSASQPTLAYEAALSLVADLVGRYGAPRVVALARRAAETSLQTAAAQVLGIGEADILAAWVQRLTTLAAEQVPKER